jgi:tol-pal system protein YbgF
VTFAHSIGIGSAALSAAVVFLSAPAFADDRRLHLAQVDQATQLQLQTMQNSIRYLQVQMQQITQIKEALAQAQQHDKEQAVLIEQRLSKIDHALSGSRLLELVSQVETLNADLNRMRGELELLRNQFDKAEKREKSLYTDLSERLKKLEQEPASSSNDIDSGTEKTSAESASAESDAAANATAPAAAVPAVSAPAESETPANNSASPTASNTAGSTATMPNATAAAANATVGAAGASNTAAASSSPAATAAATTPAPAVVASNAKPVARDPVAENKLYDEALRQFRGGNYQGAIASFQTFTDKFPGSALAPNAQYWIGVSYFNQRDFAKALQSNQALIKGYPDSAKVPDAMLNIASVHVEQSDYAAARGVLEEVIAKFPASDAAAKARTRLTLLKK